jgi:hypothetical protein
MAEDLERLKQHFPLLEYLQRHNWRGHRIVVVVVSLFAAAAMPDNRIQLTERAAEK